MSSMSNMMRFFSNLENELNSVRFIALFNKSSKVLDAEKTNDSAFCNVILSVEKIVKCCL